MAAIAYPVTVRPSGYTDREPLVARPPKRLVSRHAGRAILVRRRRLLANLVGLGLLLLTYFGASTLVGLRSDDLGSLAGARRVAGGYSYVVRPGDTLWSIASRLEPSADPRTLVDEMTRELGGARIVAGEHLFIALPR